MTTTFSYEEEKMLSEMIWIAIANGNRVEPKTFDPTPEQYRMLCGMVNKLDADIKKTQKRYGVK